MRLVAAVVVFTAVAASAFAAGSTAGRRIFDGLPGAPGVAIVGTTEVPASGLPCRACHGRDGRGGGEGAAPAITWEALANPTALRPAYDGAALGRLLARGEDPAGRAIGREMPRYSFGVDQLADLVRYLEDLPAVQKRGILSDRVVFAVPVPGDNARMAGEFANALTAALDQAMAGRRLHGRTIEVRPIPGDGARILDVVEAEAAAVVLLVPTWELGIEQITAAGVPVLFPVFPVSGTEDASLVRTLGATRADIAAAITARLEVDEAGSIVLVTDPDSADQVLRLFADLPADRVRVVTDASMLAAEASSYVVFGAATEMLREVILRAPAGVTIYGPIEELEAFSGALERRQLRALGAYPKLTLIRAGVPQQPVGSAYTSYAQLAAEVIVEAVRRGGRQLTRAKLVAALDSIGMPQLGLQFSAGRIAGSSSVGFLELSWHE